MRAALSELRRTQTTALISARSDPAKLYLTSRRLHDDATSMEPEDPFFQPDKNVATWLLCADIAAQAGDSHTVRNVAEVLSSRLPLEESYVLERYMPAVNLEGLNANLIAYDMAIKRVKFG